MRVLVTGVRGQVGGHVMAGPRPPGLELVGVDSAAMDLSEPAAIRARFAAVAPDMVIHCAAYTAVDKAEGEPALAHAVNADGAGELARLCAARGAPILHVSTDYVFDGGKDGPWLPSDPVAPLGVYGRSKEAGERQVRTGNPQHVILRTAWVYAAHGHNFVRTMLRLGGERDQLRVVADQRGCPTPAEAIAEALVRLAALYAEQGRRLAWGTYHFCGDEATTWHGFAEAIFDVAEPIWGRRPHVAAIATADYPTPAARPANSVLDCGETMRTFGIGQPNWRDSLARVVPAILEDVAPPHPGT